MSHRHTNVKPVATQQSAKVIRFESIWPTYVKALMPTSIIGYDQLPERHLEGLRRFVRESREFRAQGGRFADTPAFRLFCEWYAAKAAAAKAPRGC